MKILVRVTNPQQRKNTKEASRKPTNTQRKIHLATQKSAKKVTFFGSFLKAKMDPQTALPEGPPAAAESAH